jgi:hypothetical protein
MNGGTGERKEIAAADAERLNRLSEEIRGRLAEIALIVTRVTGAKYDGEAVGRFTPRGSRPAKEHAAATQDWIEIVEILPGFECCYGSIEGKTVLSCPC